MQIQIQIWVHIMNQTHNPHMNLSLREFMIRMRARGTIGGQKIKIEIIASYIRTIVVVVK